MRASWVVSGSRSLSWSPSPQHHWERGCGVLSHRTTPQTLKFLSDSAKPAARFAIFRKGALVHFRMQRHPSRLACSANDALSSSPKQGNQVLTLPTYLTLGRIAAIPLVLAVWYSQPGHAAHTCCGIFVLAALTDFLDGYLARRMKLISTFGAFLDPVADKLMVAAVLILLSSQPLPCGPLQGNPWVVPLLSTVIIGREIAMSALRELAASLGGAAYKAVAVSSWGKWKTATQMVSITLLLFTAGGGQGWMHETCAALGLPLLVVAAALTLLSLADYLRGLWKYF